MLHPLNVTSAASPTREPLFAAYLGSVRPECTCNLTRYRSRDTLYPNTANKLTTAKYGRSNAGRPTVLDEAVRKITSGGPKSRNA